jgi:hypothetical protein
MSGPVSGPGSVRREHSQADHAVAVADNVHGRAAGDRRTPLPVRHIVADRVEATMLLVDEAPGQE